MASPAFLSVFWSMRRRPIISAPRTSCASEPKQPPLQSARQCGTAAPASGLDASGPKQSGL